MKISPGPEELTALCELDLSTFIREAWPTVVTAEPFQANWHTDAICDHLEALARGEILNLLINVPPRTGKSNTCCVMFPSWLWVRDPTLRMVYSSYAQRLSTRDSVASRRLIESEWYRSRWGDRFSITTDQNEKTLFENDKKGFRLATSVGGVATGEGGDLVVCDDPHNVNEAESETVREGVLEWWNVTMPSRTGRRGRAMRLVIMQRVHERDLAGDLIEKGNYVHLCLPMEYEPSRVIKTGWGGWPGDPRREDGELLWPSRFSEEVISQTLRPPNMTSYAYAAQFQQRPAPIEGGMFKRSWWKYYKKDPDVVLEEARKKGNDRCQSWDCTFKETGESYVVGQVWARLGVDFYLVHQVRARMSFTATKQAMKLLAAKFPSVIRKLVEDKANGTAVIDDLRSSIPGLVAVEPRGGKESRANAMQGFVEGGNVYLPEGRPWVEDFVEEFRTFPNGENDDQVDAASQAIADMYERFKKSFDPIVTSWTTQTGRRRGEVYRDPRYSDEPVVVGYSERGDMARPAPTTSHVPDDPGHRSACRECRSRFAAVR